MTKRLHLILAGLALAAAAAACTPSGAGGALVPAHDSAPMDSGGGLPPAPTPLANTPGP